MFELPEFQTLAKQIGKELTHKEIQSGHLGNVTHRFVWYNRTPAEFATLTHGRLIGNAHARGKWLFVALEPGYVLVLGECGGKVLYHPASAPRPKKYHLLLEFTDGTALSATTQMWGAMELYAQGEEQNRQYIREMRATPVDPAFTQEYFDALLKQLASDKKYSAKALLTQDQLIPGLGNAIAQDILFRAGLHPRQPIDQLTRAQSRKLYQAIYKTVAEVIQKGGRSDEVDLYNQPGGYDRILSKDTAGHPCPRCGTTIEKIQYLGGACYYCPQCQALHAPAN